MKEDIDATRAAAKRLALQIRAIARGCDVLHHGTRYRRSIIASELLALSNSGGVYFTRDVETAVHWATLPRDDEDAGAILVFDRPTLRARYRLECTAEDEGSEESEEVVWDRHVEIAPSDWLGFYANPNSVAQGRAHLRAGELRMARETADCAYDYGARARTCSDCRAERTEKIAIQLE